MKSDPGQIYRSGTVMRFLPKRCASTDHAPGPSIASPAPNIANSIWLQGSPERQKAPHSPMIAAAPPAMGVHKPAHRNSPAAASISSPRKCCWWPDSTDPTTRSWNKKIPAPRRRQRSPIASICGNLDGYLRGHSLAPGMNRSNRLQKFLMHEILCHVSLSASFDGAENLHIAGVRR